MELGRVGIWSGQLRRADPSAISEAAAELDELGFGAIWIPGGHGGDVFGDVARLLVRHHSGDRRHWDPQHLDAHAGRDRDRSRRADRRASRIVSCSDSA